MPQALFANRAVMEWVSAHPLACGRAVSLSSGPIGVVREAFFWSLLTKHVIIRLSLMKKPLPPGSFKPQEIDMEKESEVFWLFGKIFLRVRVSKIRWYCYAFASFAVSRPCIMIIGLNTMSFMGLL